MAVDIPAVIVLAVFRPALSFLRKQESIAALFRNILASPPSMPRFVTTISVGLIILAITGGVLALNEPAKATTFYEVLEPETWVGKELPILDYIDIGKQLEKGNWLVLFYHHDCPDCITAIEKLNKTRYEIQDARYELNVALIEVPPYGEDQVIAGSAYVHGRLANVKEWFVTTPAVVLLTDGQVKQSWQEKPPEIDVVLENIVSTKHLTSSLLKGGDAWQEVK